MAVSHLSKLRSLGFVSFLPATTIITIARLQRSAWGCSRLLTVASVTFRTTHHAAPRQEHTTRAVERVVARGLSVATGCHGRDSRPGDSGDDRCQNRGLQRAARASCCPVTSRARQQGVREAGDGPCPTHHPDGGAGACSMWWPHACNNVAAHWCLRAQHEEKKREEASGGAAAAPVAVAAPAPAPAPVSRRTYAAAATWLMSVPVS